jgi:hypothetical protein
LHSAPEALLDPLTRADFLDGLFTADADGPVFFDSYLTS